MIRQLSITALGMLALLGSARADDHFMPAGVLLPGSGSGLAIDTVMFPHLRFPLEQGPAFANSQFYGVGGQFGPAGDSCDESNYSFPWHDNFCETRKSGQAFCPSGGHQGQDLRPASCRPNLYWSVAVDDGVVVQVGRYSVTLQGADGTLYRYVHINTADLAVQPLQSVTRGQRIGKVSNNWFDKVTVHLHFDVKDAVAINGRTEIAFVPPYASLVEAYRRLDGNGSLAAAAPARATTQGH